MIPSKGNSIKRKEGKNSFYGKNKGAGMDFLSTACFLGFISVKKG